MSRTITRRLNLEDTKFEYPHNFHYKYRLIDALEEKNKVTILNVLEKTFLDYIEGQEVWDFGGAGGLAYFIFKPKNVTWVVWEMPEVVDYMRTQEIDENISFKYTQEILFPETDKKIGLYSNGTINYLPNPLKFIKENLENVEYMFLDGVYIGKETALVEQERVGPCWILGLNDLKKIFRDKFRTMYREEEGPMWEVNNTDVEVYHNFDILAIRK
jgi:putative methyltransferase (TIGR04325 family)